MEQSYCVHLGFYMKKKQTFVLFKRWLYGSLCYSSQTNILMYSFSPLEPTVVVGVGSADWSDLGMGLYP